MASYKYMESALIHPVGSTMGGEHGDYDIEGIGNDFIADTMDMRLVDRVIKVTDKEALKTQESWLHGKAYSQGHPPVRRFVAVRKLVDSGARGTIVTVFPDRGERYFSKGLYD